MVSGLERPADNAERLAFAQLCQMSCKKQFAAAARFYAEAFASQPALAEDLSAASRYNAACAAALAGGGQGQDAAGFDEKERVRLRTQALAWLNADLLAWRRALEKEPTKSGPIVAQQLQHCLQDPDFNGVRGADALAKLPEAQRQSWQHLWADVAETLVSSQGRTAPKRKQETD